MKPDREDRSALFREYSVHTHREKDEYYKLFKEVQAELHRDKCCCDVT